MNLMNASTSFDKGAARQKPRTGRISAWRGFEFTFGCEYERPQIKETDESDYSEIILSNPKAFVDSLSLEAAQQLQLELIEFYRIMNTLVCKLDDKTKS